MKKTIIALFVFTSTFSFAENKDCFIGGKIELPTDLLSDTQVTVYDQTSKVNEKGEYCLTEKIKNRDDFYIYVIKDKKVILKNIFFDKKRKKNTFNINIERAMSEYLCEDRLCSENEIKKYISNEHVKEYSEKMKIRYYETFSPNFSYEKMEKKFKKQRRDAEHSNKKEIKKSRKKYFFPLDDIKSKKYDEFVFTSRDIKKYEDLFLKDKTQLRGLNDKNTNVNAVITHWLRYLYYFGDDLKFSGALYSQDFKERNDVKFEKIQNTLRFAKAYQNKTRNSSRIRESTDETSFKRTLEKIDDLFIKQGKNISNQKPDYVNIQLVFENNGWRLDTYSVNPEYYKFIDKK